MKRAAIEVAIIVAMLQFTSAEAQTVAQRVAALERRAAVLERNLATAQRMTPPVGSVVAVALTPAEVVALRPFWVPANGAILNDPESPLNGRTLPNLVGRVVLGLAPNLDAADNASTTGGSRDFPSTIQISGVSQGMVVRNCTNFQNEARLSFGGNAAVNDTPEPESACDHTHALTGTIATSAPELPLPPFRSLVYLIRVR